MILFSCAFCCFCRVSLLFLLATNAYALVSCNAMLYVIFHFCAHARHFPTIPPFLVRTFNIEDNVIFKFGGVQFIEFELSLGENVFGID